MRLDLPSSIEITACGRRPWALSSSAIAVLEMEVSAEQNRPIKHLLGLIAVRFLPGNVARPCLCATASRSVCTASHSCSELQKQQGMRTARCVWSTGAHQRKLSRQSHALPMQNARGSAQPYSEMSCRCRHLHHRSAAGCPAGQPAAPWVQ